MSHKVAVLAGDYAQYCTYCVENDLHPDRDALHVVDESCFREAKFRYFIKVGNWNTVPLNIIEEFEFQRTISGYHMSDE